ncbi:MAG: N-6 DNA methylase [Planctomycetota bacterium]
MNTFIASDMKVLELASTKIDTLINARKSHVKKFFINSLRDGHTNDSIGYLFEKTLEKFDRKDMGQYYTPKQIVEYMISQLEINKDSKILDPSCGCGSFLLNVFDVCKEKYGVNFIRNIFGVDINNDAADMARLCLYKQTEFSDDCLSSIKNNIKTGNSLSSNKILFRSAFDWDTEFSKVMSQGGFDFIIGNPPYVTVRNETDYDASESVYSLITDGRVNAATLMIGRSIGLLRNGGILAFLLPKSILFVDSYAKLRNYLAHNTEIVQIYDLGSKFKDVRGEQFILFIRKVLPNKESKTKICTFKDRAKSLTEQPFVVINQSKLMQMDKYLTFDDPAYYELVDKLSNIGIKLNEAVEGKIFRGIPIGGNHVKEKDVLINGEKVVRGKDISKFKLKDLRYLNVKHYKKFCGSKIDILRHSKIVLQNIFSSESGIIASYDAYKLLSLDTVTNILVKDETQGKYLLALLSSKLINFYVMYAIFNRSRLTMHLDKSYIGLIPFMIPPKDTLNKLIKLIDVIGIHSDSDLKKTQCRAIDKIIYNLYSLKKEEIELIEKATNNMLSKRSIW